VKVKKVSGVTMVFVMVVISHISEEAKLDNDELKNMSSANIKKLFTGNLVLN
jgi:hypothetical protein